MRSNKKYIFILIFITAVLLCGKEAEAATEFISTIRAAGGDYSMLSTWEAATQCDLTASTTVVYSGTGAGGISAGATLELFRSGVYQNITAVKVATTSSQLLVQTFTGSYKVLQNGDQWRVASSTDNMWTVSSAGLGDSAIAVAECYNDWPAGLDDMVTIDGFTANSTNYVKIYTPISERHNGRVDGSGFLIKSTSSASYTYNINIQDPYTVIDGIKIERTSANWAFGNAVTVGSYNTIYMTVKNCLFIQSSGGNSSGKLLHNGGANTEGYGNKVYNNIFISNSDTLGDGILYGRQYDLTASQQSTYYNNTIYGKYTRAGFYIDVTQTPEDTYKPLIKNNYVANTGTGVDFSFANQYSNTLSQFAYNASDDTTAGTSNNNQRITIANVKFVDTTFATADLHLQSGSAAINAGTDLSATFTTDIDGQSRSNKTWDIGADETEEHVTKINSPQTNLLNDDSLVGYWSFNGPDMDWSQTTAEARDLSGNANHGDVINGAKPAAGKVGQGLSFDGVDDYVSTFIPSQFSGTAPITISAWIKINSLAGNNKTILTSNGKIFLRTSSTVGSNIEFIILGLTDDRIGIGTLQTGVWQCVVATYNGAQFEIFINGASAGTDDTGGTYTAPTSPFLIGARAVNSEMMSGLMDEVRVYNRALSAEEIGQLYRSGARTMKIDPTKGYKTIIGN